MSDLTVGPTGAHVTSTGILCAVCVAFCVSVSMKQVVLLGQRLSCWMIPLAATRGGFGCFGKVDQELR